MKNVKILIISGVLAGAFSLSTQTLASPSEENVCNREEFSGCLNGVASSVTNGAGLRVSSSELSDVARERSGRCGR